MLFTNRGPSTAADHGVDDGGRRFPYPPPPREVLMREIVKEQICQELILQELAKARATDVCFAPGHQPTGMLPYHQGYWLSPPAATWGAWHGRPSMPPWEEVQFHAPYSSVQTSWHQPSTSAVMPPAYQHVELPPSPMPQPRSANETEQQQLISSSLSLAISPAVHLDVEKCRSLSKEPVGPASNAVIKPTEPACEEATPECPEAAQDHEAAAADSHDVQIMNDSVIQITEQDRTAEITMKDRINEHVQPPYQYSLAGQDNSPCNEKKLHEYNEPKQKTSPSGVKRKLTAEISPAKKHKPVEKWSCTLCQVNTTCEKNLEEHRKGQLHQSNLAALLTRCHENKLQEYKEPEQKTSPSGAKRKLTAEITPAKKHKPVGKWSCALCQVNTTCEKNLVEHTKGQLHRSNLAALPTRQKTTELSTLSTSESSLSADRYSADKCQMESSKWTCNICQAKCKSESNFGHHLRGRRHRENTELRAKLVNKRSLHFCEVCGVQCTSEKMLKSHLGGERHRKNVEGRH